MRITFDFDTTESADQGLLLHIARFYDETMPVAVSAPVKDPYEEPTKLAKPRGKKATETAPVVEPTATVTGPVVTEPAKVEVPTEKQLTELIAKVQKTIGLQKFREALTALGVKRVSELPQDKLVAFYAERMADVAKFERGDGSLI